METLTKHFKNLTQTVFQRHGFTQVELLQQWDVVVGPELAGIVRPNQIKWPQKNHGEKSGGTLILQAAAGRGLDAQYSGPKIQERINQYFGYHAIAAIKVLQSSETFANNPKTTTETPPSPALLTKLEPIHDPALRDALARLGANISGEVGARAKRSPQAK